jgi:signal transduction histidine kinase
MFVISSAAVIVMSLYTGTLIGFSMREMSRNIEGRLRETSRRGAALVTAAELDKYRDAVDMELPEYKDLRNRLRDFSADSDILYVYYLRAADGMMQYIVDNDFDEATRVGLDTVSTDIALTPGVSDALEGRVGSSTLGNYMYGWDGLLSAYSPIFDENGNVAAVCGVDINDEPIVEARRRVRILQALGTIAVVFVFASGLFCLAAYRREAKTARDANAAKSRFLSKVGHEMRTPLALMSSNAQVAAALHKSGVSGAGEEKFYRSLDIVKREASRLARMSDAMVALEVASSGYSDKSELDAGELVRTTAEIYRTLVEHYGNRLEIDILGERSGTPRVVGNADGLSQVLVNLVSNANEHTQDGVIGVKMSFEAGIITVSVSDNGEGIAPEALPNIFDRRPIVGKSGEVGGMGLSICKDIVTSHGGRIWIESEIGAGTTVFFTLPARGGARG